MPGLSVSAETLRCENGFDVIRAEVDGVSYVADLKCAVGAPQLSPDDSSSPTTIASSSPNRINEVGSSYRGIPNFPRWTQSRAVDLVFDGVGDITGEGTESNPFVVSCENKAITLPLGQIDVSGKYLSLVDCKFPDGRIRVGGSHIHIDNVHTSKVAKAGFSLAGDHIWISNSSALGHWAQGKDRHGFQATCGSDHIVIVDSESSGNSGDGFQAGHRCRKNRVTNIFIGGMTCNANRENCLDVKYVDGVVFSGMNSTGHGASGLGFESGSDGSSVIFGSDGDSRNAWLIDSTTDDPIGIRVEDGDGAVILGNNFSGRVSIASQKHADPLDIRNNVSTSKVFIGKPDRVKNFCFNIQGNDYSGRIKVSRIGPKCFKKGKNTSIEDLEERFLQSFGFPLSPPKP